MKTTLLPSFKVLRDADGEEVDWEPSDGEDIPVCHSFVVEPISHDPSVGLH